MKSPNFAFLSAHDELLVRTGAQAERLFAVDPLASLVKLRRFGELLALETAASVGLDASSEVRQIDLLGSLWDRGLLTPEVSQLFHGLRKAGNLAAHHDRGGASDALHQLKMARKLAIWFHRTFGDPAFKPSPFVPPPDPTGAAKALREELAATREELALAQARAKKAKLTAAEEARLREAAEAEAKAAYADMEAALDLSHETEAAVAEQQRLFDAGLAKRQAEAAKASPEAMTATVEAAQAAAADLDLNEAETRRMIDLQLVEAGWEADSATIRHSSGTRPIKGRNLAIAEWPTASGPADYVLFAGLTPVAVVEAKRKRQDVRGSLLQSKRYSRDFVLEAEGMTAPKGGPWGKYRIPFLFATNGRPYLRQLLTASGIWFLDARRTTNQPRALEGWYSPEGLTKLLAHDIAAADERLAEESADYLPLRVYQREAIAAVEAGIAAGQRELLLAMATGTGKTRTCICLLYRLLKAGRFRRALFLVDRTSLGEQAHDSFKTLKLEQQQSFTEIYEAKGLTELRPEGDTRLHVATIQGMVRRLLDEHADPIPVDEYDCIVVDECHRGYNLDLDLSDRELLFRSEADYISKYRRVLDHFDAVKIGLTATPALHTKKIFGAPVFTYSYRQAVIDDFLVDHEPPYQIATKLGTDGITWQAGEEVEVYRVRPQQLDLVNTPDEVTVEIEGFNRRVITESFNRVVCDCLAEHIDPSLPGKTLIFCATDRHADMVVDLLTKAFAEKYGSCEHEAVVKITGKSDKPAQLIRHLKNERNPRVAVTVDLLTTGIDVPEITNLVFIRRVRSRILYEQMLGRATRLCKEIGKRYFRVFDAVDLYSALEPYSSMKPVVTDPSISFATLVEELRENAADPELAQLISEQLRAKFQRKARGLSERGSKAFAAKAGIEADDLRDAMRSWDTGELLQWWTDHAALVTWLDREPSGDGPVLLISHHEDELVSESRGYGAASRPEDYLESFAAYIRDNLNLIPALEIVTQRPRELTRAQLRELKLALDAAGFTEARLESAWRDTTNQEVVATIIGHIRRQALGSPLVPYQERVARAMARLLASRSWSAPQRRWLDRIAKQLEEEKIVDREALDQGAFRRDGGFRRLNKIFDGQLEQVLGSLHEELWSDAGLKRIRAERKTRWIEAQAEKARARAEAKATKAGKPWTAEEDAAALKRERAKAAKKYTAPEPVDPVKEGLPELPGGWCWCAAEELAAIGRPIIYGIIKGGEHVAGGTPMVRVKDITAGVLDSDKIKRCAPERARRFSRAALAKGDVLISKDGTIGKTAIVPSWLEGGNISQHVLRFSPADGIIPTFLSLAIESPSSQAWIQEKVQGVALQGINVRDFRRLPIPLAGVEAQRAILEACADYTNRIKNIGFFKVILDNLCALDQSILAKAFRGELVPQDPNDEPASEFLKRIQAERAAAEAAKPKRGRKKKSSAKKAPAAKKTAKTKTAKASTSKKKTAKTKTAKTKTAKTSTSKTRTAKKASTSKTRTAKKASTSKKR